MPQCRHTVLYLASRPVETRRPHTLDDRPGCFVVMCQVVKDLPSKEVSCGGDAVFAIVG